MKTEDLQRKLASLKATNSGEIGARVPETIELIEEILRLRSIPLVTTESLRGIFDSFLCRFRVHADRDTLRLSTDVKDKISKGQISFAAIEQERLAGYCLALNTMRETCARSMDTRHGQHFADGILNKTALDWFA